MLRPLHHLSILLVAGFMLPACAPPAPATPTSAPAATATVAPPPPVAASPVPSPAAVVSGNAAAVSTGPIKRTAKAAGYMQDERGRPSGSLHPFSVTVQPGPREQEFRLGFFETNVGQLGPMWRSAGWMATSVGAFETGKDINSFRVSWETQGSVDGPSAGGLMTSAIVAGLLGDDLKTDVGFTGTINPDGSIGPVGGILYKIEAAAKDGMKTFLIPIGQRYDTDIELKQTVDVIQKGQLAGVKVQEVATLDEAYEILTGKALPRTQAPNRAPDLSSESYDRLKPKVLEWIAEYQEALGRFKTVGNRIQRLFDDELSEIDATAKRAQKGLNEGSVAAAYGDIQEAVVGINALAIGARAVEVLDQTKDTRAAINVVVQSSGTSRVQPLIERLKAYSPSSTDEAILAVAGWSYALDAVALDSQVNKIVQQAQRERDVDEQFRLLFNASAMQSTQKYVAKAAEDVLSFNFGRGRTSGQKVDPRALESWAGVFRRAAEANLNYFDTLILDEIAKDMEVRTEALKDAFAANELSYTVATFGASPGAMEYLEKNIGKTPALGYAQLGFAVSSYLNSSELVAQHYSLDGELDDDGNLIGFGRERALGSMLDAASERAKERIAALEKSGGDVSLPVIVFQAARAAREGGPKDKMAALRNYWTASTYARLMTLIAEPKS
ncbi:MAG: S16 family serine protease [Chloroflexota bacterium]